MKLLKSSAFLCLALLVNFSLFAQSDFDKSKILTAEWNRLYELVSQTEADYVVGGLYNAKEFDGVTLLWKVGTEHEVIRFYAERMAPLKDFSVTYFKTPHIVKDTMVLRRFYGPDSTGWRNDTIDFDSGDYIGRQGVRFPYLGNDDQKVMNDWSLTIFND